ncbi:hypothetical protein [Actinomadura terrae]|uniref:hypothetical protein n=1 Tax=Actinomadura terrae TaxID=604353 RepID=UPI001FA79425|nr:hypothetical protein [Actinomadura terrae]
MPGPAPRPVPLERGGRRLGWAMIGGGAALVPWMWALARRLPSTTQVSHWSTAWVGLDLMLAAGLLGTGVLLTRRDPRHGPVAAATGALLVADAWFDVMTASSGADRALAVALAAGIEIPLAILCGMLAARALPQVPSRGAAAGHDRHADPQVKPGWQSINGSTPDG